MTGRARAVMAPFLIAALLVAAVPHTVMAELAPVVTMVSGRCGGIGTAVTIRGEHLDGASVWFGTRQARTIGGKTQLIAFVPAGAETGLVEVQARDGGRVAALDRFEVVPLMLRRVGFTQGVDDAPLLWPKETNIQVFPEASEGASCAPEIDGGTAELVTTTSAGTSVPVTWPSAPLLRVDPNADSPALLRFSLPSSALQFPVEELLAVRFTLSRNSEIVLQGEVSQTGLPTFRTAEALSDMPRLLVIYAYDTEDNRHPAWFRTLAHGLDTLMQSYPVPANWEALFPKIYPQRLGQQYNLTDETLRLFSPLMEKHLTAYNQSVSPGSQANGVVMVFDPSAVLPDSGTGISWGCKEPCDGAPHHFALALADADRLGHFLIEEVAHTYGLAGVLPASNHSPLLAGADYQRLLGAFAGVGRSSPPVPVEAGEAPVLELLGTVAHNGAVTITEAGTLPYQWGEGSDSSSPYSLVFRDQANIALASTAFPVSFTVSHRAPGVGPYESPSAFFHIRTPVPPAAQWLEFQRSGQILRRVPLSVAVPQVRFVSPTPNTKQEGKVTVEWEAFDADSEELTADLFWTADGGAVWIPLAVAVKSTSVEISTHDMPGGTGMLKITVTDGFHTAYDIVSVDLPNQLPFTAILDPKPSASMLTPSLLRAVAFDPEEGWVSSARFGWTVGQEDLVSSGWNERSFALPTGPYELSARAYDSGPYPGTDSLTVSVSRLPPLCLGVMIDAPTDPYACAALEELFQRGVVTGYGDGRVAPDSVVTRAEFAKMLVLAFGKSPRPAEALPFTDVEGHWAAQLGYLQAVRELNAIAGLPDGNFRPNGPIRRGELIKIVTAAAGLAPGGESPHTDIPVGAWYKGWIGAAWQARLIGANAAFPIWEELLLQGENEVSRAEAATVLVNVIRRTHH